MPDFRVIEGAKKEDLLATLIRAIELARSSRSETTVHLLKMALLNEGIQLASDLSREEIVPAVQKEPAAFRSKFDDDAPVLGCELPSLRSARRPFARPR
jgi:hypothetical protein